MRSTSWLSVEDEPDPHPLSITPPEEIEAEADRNAAIILAWQATGLDFMLSLHLMLAGKIPEGMPS